MNIDDNRRRWLIVGLCINSEISPKLREYIGPILEKLFQDLRAKYSIDTQTYERHQKRYGGSSRSLNYEVINNNKCHGRDSKKYDYRILNKVDLSKVFLPSSVAHYKGFDETCDCSSLCGIISNIDSFPTQVKDCIEKFRSEVRNSWAHCNFTEWDDLKYRNSFRTMEELVENLSLPNSEKNKETLDTWAQKGAMGAFCDIEIPGIIHKIEALEKCMTKVGEVMVVEEDIQIKSVLSDILDNIHDLKKDIDGIKKNSSALDAKIEKMKKTVQMQVSELADTFVKTEALETTMDLLNKNFYAVIGGRPGDGKTTLAYHVLFALLKKGKTPIEIFSPNEWEEIILPNKDLAIFIDNMFGEFSVSDVTQWVSKFNTMKAVVSGNRANYLIIVIRNDIFNQCKSLIRESAQQFLSKSRVDISSGGRSALTTSEIKKFLEKYAPKLLDNLQIEVFKSSIPQIGFPQVCRLYKDNIEFQTRGLDFFENPEELMIEEIKLRLSRKDMVVAVLGYVLLNDGNVKQEILSGLSRDHERKTIAMEMCGIQKDMGKFQDAIPNAKTSFLSMDKSKKSVKFSHSSIQTAILGIIGNACPDILIRECHYNLLPNIESSVFNGSITDDYFNDFVHKLSNVIYKSEKDLNVIFSIISQLKVWETQYFFRKFSDDFVSVLVEKTDEKGFTMFVHLAATGCLQQVKYLFPRVENEEQKLYALRASCEHNKESIVSFFLENKVRPDIICAFRAVKGGFLSILKILVNAGVDLSKTCKTQTSWITITTVLEEASFFNQLHLIEPLLNLCPNLVSSKSSIGANALHIVAGAGDIKILKSLISFGFSPMKRSDIGSTILHFACQNDRFDAVKYIVNDYPKLLSVPYFTFVGGTLLSTAVESGNFDLFKYMYLTIWKYWEDNGVELIDLDPYCYLPDGLTTKTSVPRSEILKIRHYQNKTLLHYAASRGNIAIFNWLLEKGLDVNARAGKNVSVLEIARARVDNNGMVEYLQKEFPDLK